MSLSSKVNYSLEALSGITVGNINITGNIFQNNNPYIASQWTSTSGNALTYTSGNVIISSGSLLVSALTTGNINFTGTLSQNGSPYIGSQWVGTSGNISFGTTGSSQVGINTTSPGATLDVSGTGRITTSLTTGSLFSTNQTTTNIVGTRISSANFVGTTISTTNMYASTGTISSFVATSSTITNLSVPGTLTVVNITSTNLIDTTISAGTLVATSASVGNLSAVIGTISNMLVSNNTVSNSFISGGLGIGTTNPNTSYRLDVAGSIRSGLRVDIGGTQPIYNNNTLGKLFITGAQNSVPNGPNILITTAQDAFPTYNFLTYGHDSSWTMYDMYFDGSSFRNSATNTAFMMVKENSTLKWNYNSVGFSAGAPATMTTSICIGSSGNIGLGGQVTPAYTLDVSGGARIISGISAGSSVVSDLYLSSPTNATNVSSGGALTVAGGAAVGGDLIVGGSIIYSNAASVSSSFAYLTLTGTDLSTDVGNGALVAFGGISVQTTENALSATSGSGLTIGGGAGIGKDLYVGGKSIVSGGITAGSSTFTSVSAGNSQFSNLSTGNINFTGNLFQNGSAYIGSQWNGTSGSIYYGTAGSSTVGINTTNPGATLDVSGTGRITTSLTTGALYSVNQTTTNIVGTRISAGNFAGTTISTTNMYASTGTISNLVGTSISASNINVSGTLTVVNITSTNLVDTTISASTIVGTTTSTANIYASLGTVSNFVGTNISSSTLSGTSGTIGNFVATTSLSTGTLVGTTTSTANIYASLGTVSNFVGTNISSSTLSGTSGTVGNFVATTSLSTGTFVGTTISTANIYASLGTVSNFAATASTITSAVITNVSSSNMYTTILTSGNVYVTDTTVAYGFSGAASIISAGGASFRNMWLAGGAGSSTGSTPNQFTPLVLGWNSGNPQIAFQRGDGGANTVIMGVNTQSQFYLQNNSGVSSGGLFFQTSNARPMYFTGGNVGIGTSNPGYALDVTGTGNFTTSLTTGALYSTNQTTTNIVATASTITNLSVPGTLTVVNITSTNLVETNITAATIIVTGGSLNATFNANTIGSLVTTGGNVGINTSAPLFALDVNGNSRITTSGTTSNSSTTHYVGNSSGSTAIRLQGHFNGTTQIGTDGLTGRSYLQYYNDLVINRTTQGMTTASIYIDSLTGDIGLNTTDPSYKLDVNGTVRITTSLTTGALYSTNLTSTNIVGTAISGGTFVGTNMSSANISLTRNTAGITFYNGSSPVSKIYENNDLNIWTDDKVFFNVGGASTAGTTRMFINSSGYVGINTTSPSVNLDVNGTVDAITYTGANLAITYATAGTMIANDSLSIGGISSFFTGSFSANNNVTSASNVTGLLFPSASVRSFLATLTINVSKAGGNLNEMVTLEGIQRDSGWSLFDTSLGEDTGLVFTIDSTGQVKYTSINHLVWTSTTVRFEGHYYTISGTYIPTALPTTGNVAITGDLSISSTKDATNTSSGALTVLGGAGVSKSLLVGQNLNVGGVSNTFTGSFAAANNVAAATNVTGFLVPTATFSSFTASVNVRLLTTTTTLNAQYLFEATQTTSGWLLNDTAMGDSVDITFTITSDGQIQYTSTNVANWQSTTINYSVTAISISTGFTAVLPTSGSVTISGNLTIDSTTDSSSTSSASLVLAGGAGINKSLLVGGNFNIGGVTTQFAGTFSAANGASGANFTGLSFPNATIRSFSCTISIRVVSNVNYNTQHTIDGIQTATGGWQISDSQIGDASGITFAINSSGQITYTSPTFTSWTSTTMHYNAVAYNISSSYTPIPMPTGGSSSVAGSLVIQGTDPASSTSSGSLSVSGGVNIQKNLIVTDGITASTLLLTSNVNISNSSNNYSATSGGFGLTNDVVMSDNQLYFTASGAATPTLNSRSVGSKIVLYPSTGATQGDYSIGIESANMWFQVPTLTNTGYKFYQGTTPSMVISSGGNVGIGTTAPISSLHTLNTGTSGGVLMLSKYTSAVNGGGLQHGEIQFRSTRVTFGSAKISSSSQVIDGLAGWDDSGRLEFHTCAGSGNGGLLPRMVISEIGNVGIGTTSPLYKLDVNGVQRIYSGNGVQLAFSTANGNFSTIESFTAGNTAKLPLCLNPYGGNVGIGTTAPAALLTVNGNIAITPPDAGSNMGVQFFRSGIADWYMYNPSGSSNLRFYNSGDRMTLTASGNVGVGTIAPVYKLEVSQDNTGSYPGNTTTGQIIISGATDSTKRFGFQLDTVRNFGHIQVVRAGDTAYPLILNGQGGNVGVNTTNPGYTLDVAGVIRGINGTTSSVIINGDAAWGQIELYGTTGAYIDFKNNSGDDYDARIQNLGSNNSLNFHMNAAANIGMSLTSAGTLLISGDIGAFASISDRRLKTNVTDISPESALETVKTLRPVTFNWKDDIFNQARRGEFDSGFIAQEVEEVIPHAVGEYTTIDYQNTYKNMRHERIIPYLVGSIQKLEGIITELNTRIEYLESK